MKYYAPLINFYTNEKCPVNLKFVKIVEYDSIPRNILNLDIESVIKNRKYWFEYNFDISDRKSKDIGFAFDYHFFITTFIKMWHDLESFSAPILIDETGIIKRKDFHIVIIGPAAGTNPYLLKKGELTELTDFLEKTKDVLPPKKNMLLFFFGSSDFHTYTIHKIINYLICLDGLLSLEYRFNGGLIKQTISGNARRLAIYGGLIYSLDDNGQFNKKRYDKWSKNIYEIYKNFRNKIMHGDNSIDYLLIYSGDDKEDELNSELKEKHKDVRKFTHKIMRYVITNKFTKDIDRCKGLEKLLNDAKSSGFHQCKCKGKYGCKICDDISWIF